MNISREDVIVSALSSILTEKIAEVEDLSTTVKIDPYVTE